MLFVILGAEEEAASLGLLRALRDAGVAAEIYPEKGKMKKQMEYANRRSIPYVAIVGSDELARQTVTLKDMRTGEQRQVPFGVRAECLKSNDRIATESCGRGVRPGLAAPLRRMNQGEL